MCSRRGRQRQREAGPARARFDADRAAVVGDDAVNDREARPVPCDLVVKNASNTGRLLAEPGAVVLDGDLDLAARVRAASRSWPPLSLIASIALRVRLSRT
jgi:hypothetical protein